MNGIVKFFNGKKGFGFIKGDDDKDYFVHKTQLARGIFLKPDDQVTFEPNETERGPAAFNVSLAKGGAPAREKMDSTEEVEEQMEEMNDEALGAAEEEDTAEKEEDVEDLKEEEPAAEEEEPEEEIKAPEEDVTELEAEPEEEEPKKKSK